MISSILGLFSTMFSILLVSFVWTLYTKTYGAKHIDTTYDKVLSFPFNVVAKYLIK